MIYIFSERGSDGAVLLKEHIKKLGGKARRLRGRAKMLTTKDILVNWGDRYDGKVPAGVRVLNLQVGGRDKLAELLAIQEATPTPDIATRPATGFVGRTRHHQGGTDLLHPPAHPAYYVRKLSFIREWRVHVFGGKSLRVGMKVPAEGTKPHEWVRSRAGGWRLSYGPDAQAKIRQATRDAARKAVEALGLDFGAVDVGILGEAAQGLPKGTPVVLEVNSAPGLDNATAQRYAERILGRPHTPFQEGVA